MPAYCYRAKQGPEKLVEGVIEAPTESAAIERISEQGYVPVKIWLQEKTAPEHKFSPVSSKAPVAASSGPLRKQSYSWVFLFSGHLARLVKAGVPILTAIHLLSVQEKDARVRMALDTLENDIREGKTLARAMEFFPELF